MNEVNKKNLNRSALLIIFLSVLLLFSAFFFLYESRKTENLNIILNHYVDSNIELLSRIHECNHTISEKNTPKSLLLDCSPEVARILVMDGSVKLASSSQDRK